MVTVAIRRKNNVYLLKVFIDIGLGSKEGNMWYGTLRPPRQLMDDNDVWIDTPGDTVVINKDNYTTFLNEDEPLAAILNDLWLGGD